MKVERSRQSIFKIISKAIGYLVAGLMLSMVFLGTQDTHSWFVNSISFNSKVTAASTDDILEKINIESDSEGNFEGIRLKKADGKYTPIIYFEIKGEITDYILHINPVQLSNNDEVFKPIEVNVSKSQFKDLAGRERMINGSINIKYLNGFINEEFPVQFSSKWLRKQYIESLKSARGNNANDKDLDIEEEEISKKPIEDIVDDVNEEENKQPVNEGKSDFEAKGDKNEDNVSEEENEIKEHKSDKESEVDENEEQ
ncbi:hypothetical protein PRVXH_001766 [Proteinivorax hydrogeniformans]|uniref:Uncharacterized protein n=1 Tax=Proteinivorax hydrogeniformans TaxID=1826727 RepID=A0AAU8HS57_9FIRM